MIGGFCFSHLTLALLDAQQLRSAPWHAQAASQSPAPVLNRSVAGTDGVNWWHRVLNTGGRSIFVASGAVCGVPRQ